ncbi:MAG TPA: type II secretion system major pseudopilin GspG [bacterium]|nr:type II secretion system major pseudopilin GspG [bacterium]
MNNHRNREAFTLVELLLVVTIIGILAGAVMVNFSGQTQKAKIVRAQSDISNIGSALNVYEITIGSYPTNDQGLRALVEDPGDVPGWKPFLQQKTFNDPWGREYRYSYPGSKGVDYDLYSVGPDGQDGTEDDIGNWKEGD